MYGRLIHFIIAFFLQVHRHRPAVETPNVQDLRQDLCRRHLGQRIRARSPGGIVLKDVDVSVSHQYQSSLKRIAKLSRKIFLPFSPETVFHEARLFTIDVCSTSHEKGSLIPQKAPKKVYLF